MIAGIGVLAWILAEAGEKNDFDIFLLAANELKQGGNIYTATYFDGYHFFYSTLFALLLAPFTALPVYGLKVAWLALNILFTYRIFRICFSYLDTSGLQRKSVMLLAMLSFAFVLRFARDNFHVAQMTICMLYLPLEGMNFILKGKKMAGAALIALAINIKLLPLVLVPYLLYRRELAAVAMVITGYVAFMFLPALFIGYDHNSFLLHEWWKLVNPTNTEHVIDVSERSFHGLSTLLPTLLMENVHEDYALALKRNIADLTPTQVNLVLNAVRLALAAFTLYFLRSMPFKRAGSKLQTLWELSYIFMLVPLIFPHQQHYAFFFILPAVIYVLYFLMMQYQSRFIHFSKRKFYSAAALMAVIFLVCNSTILLGTFREYYDHFKILTYAALLLIIPLAMCRPSYLEVKDQPL